MNLFEKIFNYQVMSRIQDLGAVALTRHERSWLAAMLAHPSSSEAFEPSTLDKIKQLLEGEDPLDLPSSLLEKARSAESMVYHPLLRSLRRIIGQRSGFRLTFQLRNGRIQRNERGVPYQLEYSMVKREWYVLWYHQRRRCWMATKLTRIIEVEEAYASPVTVTAIMKRLDVMQRSRTSMVTVEVVRTYNQELSRILYAFSCFDKDVDYDEAADTYRIRLRFPGDETDYLRSKIRFLGMRVKVVEGDYVKERMYESAMKALARYGEVPEPADTLGDELREALAAAVEHETDTPAAQEDDRGRASDPVLVDEADTGTAS